MQFESGLLHVVVTGEVSLQSAEQSFLEVLGAVVQYQAKKVLIDGRTAKGNPGDLERFLYGEFAAKETMRLVKEHGIFPQVAWVAHVPLRDPRKFAETVAVNRGMNLRVCKTPEEAFAWLELTPPNKPDAGDA